MNPIPAPNYLMYYFFLGNFDIIQTKQWMFPFLHLWSICVEEHFYIVWPFILAFFSIKNLKFIFAAVIGISLSTRLYYFIYCPDLASLAIYLNTLSRIDIIVLGAIAAYIHFKTPIKLNVSKPIRILLLLVIVACFCVDYVYSFNSFFAVTIKEYLYCIASGFLMLNFLFNDNKLIHFKKKGLLHYIGKISFGVYIYHNIILGIIMDNIVARYGGDKIGLCLFLILYLGSTLLLSVISWELFEKQILKFKSRFELIPTKR
jgi:peptidoglycan/LPS O-acetylase OafA/YrhL